MNGPVRKPFVKVRRVVRLLSRRDTLAIAKIVRRERHKTRFDHVDGERQVWVRRTSRRATGEPDRRGFAGSAGRAVKAYYCRPASFNVLRYKHVSGHTVVGLHLDRYFATNVS